MINKLLQVRLKRLPLDDRDSYINFKNVFQEKLRIILITIYILNIDFNKFSIEQK